MRNPQLPKVAVITPTYKRDVNVIDRCVLSVGSQSYDGMILHIICSDGPEEEHVKNYVESLEDPYVVYTCTGENTNSYGGGVREYVLKNFIEQDPSLRYLVHLDDDNVLFPHFIERNVEALEANPDKEFSICKILHLGPLPQHLGPAPQVINGIPPVFQNIDTLQVVVRRDAMIQCRWNTFSGEQGYYNDGYTYDRLGKMFEWVEVPELLAVHI
jgi:glycosyltransferase involved in cell wall biosynthesis